MHTSKQILDIVTLGRDEKLIEYQSNMVVPGYNRKIKLT